MHKSEICSFLLRLTINNKDILHRKHLFIHTPPRTQLDAVKSAGEFLYRKAEAEVGGRPKNQPWKLENATQKYEVIKIQNRLREKLL